MINITSKGWLPVLAVFAGIQQGYPQHSPQQPFKGTIGQTLGESVPYKIEYNKKANPDAPNVVWILIDDAGFGSSSAFGGLVETPNIDKLANNGIRFTNFHTTAICSPTRAALITGRNHHSAHVGLLTPAAVDFPGYDTRIPFEKATVAEILRENGYNTFALGKWHITPIVETGYAGPFNRWPTGRGFDHFYGFHMGATDQWYPELWEDQTKIDWQPKGKHLNELLADKAIRYIANQKSGAPEKPFFLYLATGATHAPHQVAKAWIDRYKGKFDFGWDKYREIVIERQKKLGVIPPNAVLPERNPTIKAWDSLSGKEKKVYAHFMEAYAGFFSYTDYEIGRIINYLEQIDQLDNTLVVLIIGDNGASKEGGLTGSSPAGQGLTGEEKLDAIARAQADPVLDEHINNNYPTGWAMAANTPFRYWKQDANTEGGTRNPMIISYPNGIKNRGEIRNQYGHVIDVLPTTLEIIHGKVPDVINGYTQQPIEGISLAYAIGDAKAPSRHTVQYYEIAGARSIYKDGWKASGFHTPERVLGLTSEALAGSYKVAPDGSRVNFSHDIWELYNLDEDFNERIDLAAKYPEKLKELQAVFDEQAKKYNVYPLKDFTAHDMPAGRTRYGKEPLITLFPGVDHLVGVNSPLYDNRSFTVTAETEIVTGEEEGVLFAVGGETSGISLFIRDGKLRFVHKVGPQAASLVSPGALPKGEVTFGLRYTFTGPKPDDPYLGTEELLVNGQNVAERKIPKGQATIRSGNEDGTDIGRDLYYAVSDQYQAPFNFTGKIKKVTIGYAKEPGNE